MTPAEVVAAEVGTFLLAGEALAGYFACRITSGIRDSAEKAGGAVKEALAKNWVKGGFTITAPDGRYPKPLEAPAGPAPAEVPVAVPQDSQWTL